MLALITRLIEWLARAGDLWSILQLAVPGLTGAVMVWLGIIAEARAVHIVFFALVGAASAAILVDSVRAHITETTVFRRLTVRQFNMLDGEIQAQTRTAYLTLSCVLENNSNRPLFYKALRLDLSLQDRINPQSKMDGLIGEIAGKSHRYMTLATISDLDLSKIISGRFEAQIEYGPSVKALKYRLDYEGTPTVIVRWDGKQSAGELNATVTCTMQKNEHARLKLI